MANFSRCAVGFFSHWRPSRLLVFGSFFVPPLGVEGCFCCWAVRGGYSPGASNAINRGHTRQGDPHKKFTRDTLTRLFARTRHVPHNGDLAVSHQTSADRCGRVVRGREACSALSRVAVTPETGGSPATPFLSVPHVLRCSQRSYTYIMKGRLIPSTAACLRKDRVGTNIRVLAVFFFVVGQPRILCYDFCYRYVFLRGSRSKGLPPPR